MVSWWPPRLKPNSSLPTGSEFWQPREKNQQSCGSRSPATPPSRATEKAWHNTVKQNRAWNKSCPLWELRVETHRTPQVQQAWGILSLVRTRQPILGVHPLQQLQYSMSGHVNGILCCDETNYDASQTKQVPFHSHPFVPSSVPVHSSKARSY